MSPPLFSTPALHEQPPEVKRAMERMIAESSREGLISQTYMVPLYDEGERVRVVADEEYSAGPTAIIATAPSWQNLLTATLELEAGVSYLINGAASCDMHLQAGANWNTAAVRVHDGTNTLHTLYASSQAFEQYVPITVPFILAVEALSTVSITMDTNIVMTAGGGPMDLERIRLIVWATPIHLEGVGA